MHEMLFANQGALDDESLADARSRSASTQSV